MSHIFDFLKPEQLTAFSIKAIEINNCGIMKNKNRIYQYGMEKSFRFILVGLYSLIASTG